MVVERELGPIVVLPNLGPTTKRSRFSYVAPKPMYAVHATLTSGRAWRFPKLIPWSGKTDGSPSPTSVAGMYDITASQFFVSAAPYVTVPPGKSGDSVPSRMRAMETTFFSMTPCFLAFTSGGTIPGIQLSAGPMPKEKVLTRHKFWVCFAQKRRSLIHTKYPIKGVA